MTSNVERVGELRYMPGAVEDRTRDGVRRIGGMGVPYGKRSRLLPGGYFEVVEKRALAKTLADNLNVVSRLEHHPEWLLATTDSDTMRLEDGPDGLSYELDLPNTTAGNDTHELVRTNRLRGASMGFQAFEQEFARVGGSLVRHLISIRLDEISPVSQPAYDSTSTSLRNYEPAWTALANQLGEDPEEVFALAQKGELRSLVMRTDQQVAAMSAPLQVANRKEDRGMDTDLARRILANQARQMAADGDPLALNQLQGEPVGMDIDLAQRRSWLWQKKAQIDADEIALLELRRNAYNRQPDVEAQRQQQQEAIRAEAIRRRINALAQDGIDAGVTGWGATATHHGPAGPVIHTQRQSMPANNGWIGT